jgi:LmbE family N-acetylglucosaminyl deacetylase
VVFLTSGELGLRHLPREQAWKIREAESRAAADVLGVARTYFLRQEDWYIADHADATAAALADAVGEFAPQQVYLPHAGDSHPDHRAAATVLRKALATMPVSVAHAPERILAYEVWTPIAEYDHVEDVSRVMHRKLAAVRCYGSQLEAFRYDRAVRGLNQYRGALAGRCRYAEVFQNLKLS